MTVMLDLDPALMLPAVSADMVSVDAALQFVEALPGRPDVVPAVVGDERPMFFIHLDEHLVIFDRGFRRLLPTSALTVLDPTTS